MIYQPSHVSHSSISILPSYVRMFSRLYRHKLYATNVPNCPLLAGVISHLNSQATSPRSAASHSECVDLLTALVHLDLSSQVSKVKVNT